MTGSEPTSKNIEGLTAIGIVGFYKRRKRFRDDIFKIYEKFRDKIFIGVFGYYDAKYPDGKRGREVIDFLSKEFTERNCFVINGGCVMYTDSRGRNVTISTVHNDLCKTHSSEWGNDVLSRIFASIPPNAVFLVRREAGSDTDEVSEFLKNEHGDKETGIGYIIVERVLNKCNKLKEHDVSINHHYCFSNDLKSCELVRGDCVFTNTTHGGGIAAGRIQKFIKGPHMCLCTIDEYVNIPDAAINTFHLHRISN